MCQHAYGCKWAGGWQWLEDSQMRGRCVQGGTTPGRCAARANRLRSSTHEHTWALDRAGLERRRLGERRSEEEAGPGAEARASWGADVVDERQEDEVEGEDDELLTGGRSGGTACSEALLIPRLGLHCEETAPVGGITARIGVAAGESEARQLESAHHNENPRENDVNGSCKRRRERGWGKQRR